MKILLLTASLVLGVAAIPAAAGAQDYPPCGRDQTDKCMQTHEGGGMAMGEHHMMMHHHMMRHHMMMRHHRMMRHHMRHHMRHRHD